MPATIRQIIGANTEARRRDMGLSQEALGARMSQWLDTGWTRQAVSQAESGKRAFGIDDLVGLSIGLRLSIRELMTAPLDVETVTLASGMEVPAGFIASSVAGSDRDGQRARLTGAIEAINGVSTLLDGSSERLREQLARLWDNETPDEEAGPGA